MAPLLTLYTIYALFNCRISTYKAERFYLRLFRHVGDDENLFSKTKFSELEVNWTLKDYQNINHYRVILNECDFFS
jgi:hypothetical protein